MHKLILITILILLLFTPKPLSALCSWDSKNSGWEDSCDASGKLSQFQKGRGQLSAEDWVEIEKAELIDQIQDPNLLPDDVLKRNSQQLTESQVELLSENKIAHIEWDQMGNKITKISPSKINSIPVEQFSAELSSRLTEDQLAELDSSHIEKAGQSESEPVTNLQSMNPLEVAEAFNSLGFQVNSIDFGTHEVSFQDGELSYADTNIYIDTFDDSLSFLPTGHVVINNYAFLKGKDIRKEGQAIIADTATGEIIINNINSSIENAKDTRITKSSFELSKAESVILENYV